MNVAYSATAIADHSIMKVTVFIGLSFSLVAAPSVLRAAFVFV
jgi:hypothetical protein